MRTARKAGARLICLGEEDYPRTLAEIDDPPPLFWAKGDPSLLNRGAIALVGARNASALGERTARHMAKGLGTEGYVVVSGLARGIDAAAHDAALRTGTVAVMGGGLDVIYPAENDKLYRRIAEAGLLMSEQPMGLAPQARHFPRRNRIISGLARALVVVEAAGRSGSLITARNAAEQGREVLAVPGHPFDGRASGCNMLIRDGATLVRSPADVLEAIGPGETAPRLAPSRLPAESRQARPTEAPDGEFAGRADSAAAAGGLESRHAAILQRLGPTPLSVDALIRDVGMAATDIAPILTDLELDGRIRRHAGGLVSLT